MFYREFTKANNFEGSTQLGLVHSHFLVLGFVFFLIVLILDRLLGIAKGPVFTWFFWTYNAGLMLTGGAMIANGSLTVVGEKSGAAVAGIAGLGHILLTVALILFMVTLGRRVFELTRSGADKDAENTGAAGRAAAPTAQ